MKSSTAHSQFQLRSAQISNLDRCYKCGDPRAAHGIDWSCPTGFRSRRPSRRRFVFFVLGTGAIGIAVTVLLILTSATGGTLASISAAGTLGILVLLVCLIALSD